MAQHKILVVEDENPRLIKQFLRRRGFEVLVAEDGGEAVEIAAAEAPDLVLLDIMLPVLDGFEVLEELKRRQIETRVVMYSGYFTDMDTAIRCVRNGACDFISKHEWPEDLPERLRKYILIENTLNLRVSDLTPVVEKLITEAEALELRGSRLQEKVRRLSIRRSMEEVGSKSVCLAASVATVYLLVKLGLVASGGAIAVLFLTLFIFMLIPTGQLKRISATLKSLKARIELK